MSSIDDKQRRALLRFYQLSIRSRAAQPRSTPATSDDSHYIKREPKPITREDMEIPLGDVERIGDALDAFWAGTRLAGLGREIAELSKQFPNVRERSDVSSFVYEMF